MRRYWHRSLNPKKLIDVGFSRLANHMTMARTIKLYKLPDKCAPFGQTLRLPTNECRSRELAWPSFVCTFVIPHVFSFLQYPTGL